MSDRSPDSLGLRRAVEAELDGNLLPFWRERSLDETHGGFIAEMANDGTLDPGAPKGLILTARLLWTFSTLFTERADFRDLALARRALDFLQTRLRDRENGGYLWRVDSTGRPLDREKKVYGQAFAIYALSAYSLAAVDENAGDAARELFVLLERHAHDDENDGYIEALAADWTAASEQRLSGKDMDAPKSMNTHLHVLEAYTGLYRIWPEPAVATRLRELIELFGSRILDRGTGHLHHFFDDQWRVISDSYTYGHDIEAAWLLHEAAQVLNDTDLEAEVEEWAIEIGRAVLAEAIDGDGGLAYEGRDGVVIDPNREWWCQAEAVVGFWTVYELTGDSEFAYAAERVWGFILERVVDRAAGEWFWRVFPDGSVDPQEPKLSEWKGPYHNVRMCLEIMRRIDNTLGSD